MCGARAASLRRAGVLVICLLSLGACGVVDGPFGGIFDSGGLATTPTAEPDPNKAELGRQLFADPRLSASGTESCASCHQREHAFTGNNHGDDVLYPVSVGAYDTLLGDRNAPTIMYMRFSPPFHFALEQEEEEGDELEYTPTGGQFWDGRADTLAQQAQGPIINPREMAMPDKAAVAKQIAEADYAPLVRSLYGDILSDVDVTYDAVTDAIAAFESTDQFAPFSSKFDAVLLGEADFTAQEARGFELFKDPKKGNCISCHAGGPDSKRPRDWLFTDFTYDNLGVPRNPEIPDNDDPEFFDLGLCQSPGIAERAADIPDAAQFVESLCGAFKVPTLRNVALTAPYMHNGRFTELRDVVEFYVTRDTNPGKWYPASDDGGARKFDDLPPQYRGNVNTKEVPYDRHLGDQPHLSPDEIDAVVAFLETLSDGYAE